MREIKKCDQTVFFDITGYFEIPEFEILRIDCSKIKRKTKIKETKKKHTCRQIKS